MNISLERVIVSNGDNNMAISYNKLWKLLIDKKMSNAGLRKAADIPPNTLTRMKLLCLISELLLLMKFKRVDISTIVSFVIT